MRGLFLGLFFWVCCWWFILGFVPCRGRLTFFVLPKKVSKERRARCGEPLLEFVSQGGRGGKLAALRQASLLFPHAHRNSRRRIGQGKAKPSITSAAGTHNTTRSKASNNSKSKGHPGQHTVGVAFDFPALDGALDFCCGEDKEGRLV
jgi:hypothetical protein